MKFTANVYFDVGCPHTWLFFKLLDRAHQAGVELDLTWRPFSNEQGTRTEGPAVWETLDTSGELHALATFAWVKENHPNRQFSYVQVLLVAAHDSGLDVGDWRVLERLGAVAGVDGGAMVEAVRERGEGYAEVAASHEKAVKRGVFATPTIVRGGPAMLVRTNGAALIGDPERRLRVIKSVLDDDGLWELRKP